MTKFILIDGGSSQTRTNTVQIDNQKVVEGSTEIYYSTFKETPYANRPDTFNHNGIEYEVAGDFPLVRYGDSEPVKAYGELGRLQIAKALSDYRYSEGDQIIYAVSTNTSEVACRMLKPLLSGEYSVNGTTYHIPQERISVVTQGRCVRAKLIRFKRNNEVYCDVGFLSTDIVTSKEYLGVAKDALSVLVRVGGRGRNAFSTTEFMNLLNQVSAKGSVGKETTKLLKEATQAFIDTHLTPFYLEMKPTDSAGLTIGGGFGTLLLLHKVKGLRVAGKGVTIEDGRFAVMEGLQLMAVKQYKEGAL